MIRAYINLYRVQIYQLKLTKSPEFLRLRVLESVWETLHIYDESSPPLDGRSQLFLARRGKQWKVHSRGRNGGKIFDCVEYLIDDPQPSQDILQDADKWKACVKDQD